LQNAPKHDIYGLATTELQNAPKHDIYGLATSDLQSGGQGLLSLTETERSSSFQLEEEVEKNKAEKIEKSAGLAQKLNQMLYEK